MTTRHTAWKGLQFDHGCQFIRASTTEFRAVVDEWTEAGEFGLGPSV
jgi:predicted NAD/FAD-dependent oxidoreductase